MTLHFKNKYQSLILLKFIAFVFCFASQSHAYAFNSTIQSNGREMHIEKNETVSYSEQTLVAAEPVLAFPGADGWGRYTTGGRGGEVIYVTNLNDDGPGSLRAAVTSNVPRTVVFSVSGTIELKSNLRINRDNITIAGQTAPGDGITIKGRPVDIRANNVIIRHLRFRSGDYVEDDALKGTDQRDIIIDHCSMSWGVDEVASFYRNENFTLQNSIISESLYRSIHSKGDHGYGGIWGGNKASFLRNLIAHHTSRTPRFNGARYTPVKDDKTDFRNNVIYNWGFNNAYGGDPNEVWGTKANINVVNNFYKPGPATNSGAVSYRVLEPYSHSSFGYSLFHVHGNEVYGYPDVLNDNWGLGVQNVPASEIDNLKKDSPFDFLAFETLTASEAFEYVLENAGARLPRLDAHDIRVIEETRTGTAIYGGVFKGANTGIIDKPADVGGWLELFSAPASLDSDGDGMPDEWEIAHGLDPFDPSDRNDDMHGLGYTNLEYYLNSIEAKTDFVRPPTQLLATATNVTEITLEWIDNSELEEGFFLERKVDGGDFVVIETLAPNTTSYIDSNLDEEREYTYRVRAFGEPGYSIYSNEATAATHSANAVPLPVSNPYPANNAINVSTGAVLAWDASMGADSYDIYFGQSSNPEFMGNQTETTFEVELEYGNTYYWRVEAVNEVGATNENLIWKFTIWQNIEEQLVGHWSLDSYSNLLDSSVFANHGTAVNVGFAAAVDNAPRNRAIRFNGNDQYIHIPHSYEFDFDNSSFTVAFWLRHDAATLNEAAVQPYIFKGDYNSEPTSHYYGKYWQIYSVPANNEFVFSLSDGKISSQLIAPTHDFVKTQWVHISAVRDSQNGKLRLYANGSLVSEADDNTGDLSQYEDLYFAHRPHDETFYRGAADDVRLYNYAFSQSHIDELLGLSNSVDFRLANFQFELYPNPSTYSFLIRLPISDNFSSLLHIFDNTGRRIRSKPIENRQLANGCQISTEGMPNGTYYLQLATREQVFTSKLVVVGK